MSEREKDKLVNGFSQEELIAGFRKGDPRVIDVIYELHFVPLCDFCYFIMGNIFDAQDLVSEVFVKLLTVDRKNKEIGQSFADMNDIVNYLYVAAKNRCVNLREQNKRKEEINQQVAERKYSLDEELDLEYHKGLGDLKLLETVYSLSQRCVQVLRKIYFEDMSYEEIATEMNITRATVSSLRKRGIDVLARQLNREDFIYHISVLAILTLSVI